MAVISGDKTNIYMFIEHNTKLNKYYCYEN